MTAEEIKHILDTLHSSEDHKYWDFDSASGDTWGGYTRNGYEITYYPETNTYTWRNAFDNGFTNIEYDKAFEISEADLIARLATINYPI
jgi:hypothetical protein